MKNQLLCTFTESNRISICISQIYKVYDVEEVTNMKCYAYVEVPDSVVCIYNVSNNGKRLKDTITINRKKESNTFYSINALNSLIFLLNNGILDKSYKVDWLQYADTLLLADGESNCRIIKIKEISI